MVSEQPRQQQRAWSGPSKRFGRPTMSAERSAPRLSILIAALASVLLSANAFAKAHLDRRDPFRTAAVAYATVLDGELLWGRNVDVHRAPASLTKLLTALVLLDSDWQPEALLPVSHAAAHVERQRIGFRTGDQVRA